MTTLAAMKARIGSELRRSNLTTQIASAISSAIGSLEDERWSFTESRALTFNTVANQEFYGSSDSALIPRLEKIDYAKIIISDYPYDLLETSPSEIETLNRNGTQTGEPVRYCYYAQKIRLCYVPADVWTVRIGGVVRVPEPATDNEANNPWMTTAERLVRSRAKLELAIHVLRDPKLAEDMAAAVEEAGLQLRRRTNRIQGGQMLCEGGSW